MIMGQIKSIRGLKMASDTEVPRKLPNHILGFAVVHDSGSYQTEFNSGGRRPAFATEIQFQRELDRALEDHGRAARLAWGLYEAAMGISIKDFNGLSGDDPISVVRTERKRLQTEIFQLNATIEYLKQNGGKLNVPAPTESELPDQG